MGTYMSTQTNLGPQKIRELVSCATYTGSFINGTLTT